MLTRFGQWLARKSPRNSKRNKRSYVLLTLESLEPRIALDSNQFTWTGADKNVGILWSDRSNWVWPDNTIPTRPLGAADDVTFGAVQQNASADSTDDVPQVTTLIITSGYQGTITQAQNLAITGPNSSMAAGTLNANGKVFSIQSNFAWTGGAMRNGTVSTFNVSTVTISGSSDKILDGLSQFLFYGTANWDGAGRLLMKNQSLLSVAGTFNINGPGSIQDGGGTNNVMNIQGSSTLTVNPGAAKTATVSVQFNPQPRANTNVQSGTLLVNAGSDLKGTITVSAGAQVSLSSVSPNVDKLTLG